MNKHFSKTLLTGLSNSFAFIMLTLPQLASARSAPQTIETRKTAVEIPEDPAELQAEPRIESQTGALPAAYSREMSEITEADGTTVILPPGYTEGRTYPALVLMPYTNRTALHMFNWGIYDAYHQRTHDSFVIIMPPGQGSSANWSGSGWTALVNEYERYVQQTLPSFVEKYNIAPEQLVVGGFSLGGDLSWTLSLRNPDIFSGAIVMGSMSNHRNSQNAQRLAQKDFRYFMVMGGHDGNRSAMYNALDVLDTHNITYRYEEVGNAGHGDLPEKMQRDLFLAAMDYVIVP